MRARNGRRFLWLIVGERALGEIASIQTPHLSQEDTRARNCTGARVSSFADVGEAEPGAI